MANRSFIIAVVLLVGAAILFSGMGNGVGKYASGGNSRNSLCNQDYVECGDYALAQRTTCLGQDLKYSCEERYAGAMIACREILNRCVRDTL
jgi:hypothetical protein